MAKAIKTAIIAAVVVYAVVATAGAAGFAIAGGMTIGGLSVAASMAVMTFATTLISAGIGMMTSKGQEANNANFGTKASTRGALAPRQIIYGETRVGGTITFMRTTGTDNNKLSMVVVFAGHEVDSFTSFNFNEITVTTTNSTSSGAGTDNKIYTVTNSDFTNTDNENNFGSGRLVRFTFHDGSQTSHDSLARTTHGSTIIDNNFIYKDCAYMYVELIYDPEKMPQIPKITGIIKGKKLYDPRLDSTVGGSGSHRLGTESTYAWSDNPALCILDYLSNTTYGIKATSTELNLSANAGGFMSAANTSEQTVTISGISQERYTANGFTNMSANGNGILEGLLSSCGGKLTFTNGMFNVFVAAAQTPSLTITDSEVLSPINVSKNTQSNELFNSIKAVFVDKDNGFVGTDTPELTSSTFVSEDVPSGEANANYLKRMEIQLPYTSTNLMAERLAKISLQHQRKTLQISLLTTTKFLRLQPADFVYVTNERLGYTNKMFEVLSTQIEFVEQNEVPVAACRLVLKEIDAATYDFVTNDYVTPITQGPISEVPTGDFSVSAPTNLAVAQVLAKDATTSKINIKATWTNNSSPYIFGTEVAYKLQSEADSLYRSITVGAGTSTAYLTNVAVGEAYVVRVRHMNQRGVFSPYTGTASITMTAASAAPSDPSNLSASTGKAFNIVVSYTNPNNGDLKGVKIYRKTSNSTPNANDSDGLVHTQYGASNTISTFVDGLHNGLTAGTTYYYWVRAINHSDVNSNFVGSVQGNFTSVKNADIQVDAIQGDVLAANAITETKISDDSITSAKIVGRTIVAGDIATGTLTANELAADSVTANEIDVTNLAAISADMGTITAGSIVSGTIKATTLELNGSTLSANAGGLFINTGGVGYTQIGSDSVGAYVVNTAGTVSVTNSIYSTFATVTGLTANQNSSSPTSITGASKVLTIIIPSAQINDHNSTHSMLYTGQPIQTNGTDDRCGITFLVRKSSDGGSTYSSHAVLNSGEWTGGAVISAKAMGKSASFQVGYQYKIEVFVYARNWNTANSVIGMDLQYFLFSKLAKVS
jgi:hypothetical protein